MKALPENLTVKQSNIDGLGLFALNDIDKDICLGISHIKCNEFPNGYARTPLGGFYNHSDNPNIKGVTSGEFIYLKTIKRIKAGEELVGKYNMYSIK
jgi:SET domain-containing protein